MTCAVLQRASSFRIEYLLDSDARVSSPSTIGLFYVWLKYSVSNSLLQSESTNLNLAGKQSSNHYVDQRFITSSPTAGQLMSDAVRHS